MDNLFHNYHLKFHLSVESSFVGLSQVLRMTSQSQ